MDLEEVDERRLILLPNTLQLKNLSKIRLRLVCDVNKVRLHQTLGRRRPHLERLKKRIKTRHSIVDPFNETCRGSMCSGRRGE